MNLKLKFLLFFMLMLCLNIVGQNAQKPNIIFILTDDQGWNDLSINTDNYVHNVKNDFVKGSTSDYHETPHTDSLLMNGMRFSNAYSPHSLCQPSRHSIQFGISTTSLNHVENGVYDSSRSNKANALVKTIKKIEPKYKAGAFGKWHVASVNKNSQDALGYDVWHTGNPDDGHELPPDQKSGTEKPDGSYINDDPKFINTITDEAIDFITNQADNDTPFFCYIAHWAPHYPYVSTQASWNYFKSKAKGSIHENIGRAAMMMDLDAGIGRVLDKVNELGIGNNTYIIFTSDNGSGVRGWEPSFGQKPNWGDPEPLYGGKGTLYQGGIRVPFAISGPGISAGTWNSTPIIGYDIYPTICDLIGGASQIPNVVEGASIKDHCLNGSTAKLIRRREVDGFAYVYNKPSQPETWEKSAFVQGDYKILLQHEENPDTYNLFNIKEDIGERTNLASSNPDKFANLLREWYNHVVDKEVTLPKGALTQASDYLDNYYTRNVPGTLEAEDYKSGFGMVVGNTNDTGGGEYLEFIDTNDFMDYRIIPEEGDYEITFRVAAKTANIKLELLEVDHDGSTNLLGGINEAPTGSLQTWKNTQKITVTLDGGAQVVRVKATSASWNLNSIEFTKVGNTNPTATEIRLENVSGVHWLKNQLDTVICAPTTNTGDNTKWEKTADGDYFSLRNQGSGNYLSVSGTDVILSDTYDDKAKWKFTATGSNWFIDNKWCLDNNQNARLKFLSDDVFLATTANSGGYAQWTALVLNQALSNSVLSNETNSNGIDAKIVPNPSDGNITVSFDQPITNGTWKITNISGQLVSEGTLPNKNTMELSIHRDQGLYFLSLVSKNGIHTMPIMITK